ncbi:MAG: Sec-independent protein translocase subunit TatC, sec-independent protein translocase protein TatC [Candidatus Saccharibacteria bacterium]|nr:Sec-independent protein translocase subunit TatC, sec-independent protein translocase protein TatC [Candidatus Saccharibacteria bacterium]
MGIKNKKQQSTSTQTTTNNEPGKQTFREHLRAFRGRLLWFVGSFIVASVIGFEFKDIIQGLFTMQLTDLNLINLAPSDDLQSTLQISLYAGIVAGLPLAIYHAYRFVEPVLNRGTSYAVRLLMSSAVLVAAAISLAFMVTIPLALGVMIHHGQDAAVNHVSTQSFLNFAVPNLIAITILFQLPLLIVFSNSVQAFSKKRKAWLQRIVLPVTLITSWLASSFISFNRGIVGMLLIAVPTIVMFEIAMFWAHKHPGKAIAQQPIQQHSKAVETIVEQPQEEVYEQPVGQLATEPATFKFVSESQKTIPETQALEPFPDEMFDAMLQDKDEYAYDDQPSRAPLPSSLEVIDESRPIFHAPIPAAAPVIRQQPVHHATPVPVAMQQPTPVPRPQPMTQTIVQAAPASVVQRPVILAPAAVTPTPAQQVPVQAPRFAASFSPSRPQPIAQPQPIVKQPAYSRPITETLKPQQTQTPPLRSPNAPQQTIPFQMRPVQPYGNTIEGLLPA